jgi:DNA invertase Pin-like site-specific DNA recombinase
MLEGARLGRYGLVLTWGIDRLSRRGAEDMLSFVRRLTDTGCRLWSLKNPWAESTADPMTRELLFGAFATIARFESERRSERTRAGIRRRKEVDGLPAGRQPGAADKKPRRKSG